MKNTTIRLTGSLAALLLAGLCLAGCGTNEAQETQSLQAAPRPVVNEQTIADERENELAEREAELVRREQALADVESQLTARMQQVASRVDELEQREAELERRDVVAQPSRSPEPQPEPAPSIETAPRSVMLSLPPATALAVRFEDKLSSETSLAGDHFRALVVRDVTRDGLVAIPAGTEVRGSVASVVPQKRIGGQAKLALSFDRLYLPSGESVAISAALEQTGKPQKKRDAATIGGSAAGGAILGRVLSNKKGKGTAIGAIVGAAIGTAVASETGGDPARIEPGMTAEVFLDSPIEVAVAADGARMVAGNR
jgi:hypothetical protein